MASGVGAGIMMASATASLSTIYPTMADQLSALASAGEAIFIGIPLTKKLYDILAPRISRKRGE